MRKGNRDQQGTAGQRGKESAVPKGTSGRVNPAGTGSPANTDMNRPATRPRRQDDDEDSGLGNRNTNR